MLTRFEVSGFKNLTDVVLDLGPFTCIAGPNAVGKSNLFDAIEFLSLLADNTFVEACAKIRAVESARAADLKALLSTDVIEGKSNLRFAAEMIVPEKVQDEFSQEAQASKTYVRYEVELTLVPDPVQHDVKTLRLAHELLKPLAKNHENGKALFGQYPPLKGAVTGRRKIDYMTMERDHDDKRLVAISVSGEQRGRPRKVSVERSQRTVLSALASAEYPTLLAARAEMASWRLVALESTAMRSPDDRMETREIDAAGAHIPATLHRRRLGKRSEILKELTKDVSALVDLRSLTVFEDDTRQTLELRARVGEAPELPARSLSDGTLRFLALAAMKYTEVPIGLLCMEEPENGIHPAKIEAMLNLLRRLSEPIDTMPRQVLINTHSPYMVQEIQREHPEEIVVAQAWRRRSEEGEISSTTSFHPLPGTWRALKWEALEDRPRAQAPVSLSKLFAFLKNPSTHSEVDSE